METCGRRVGAGDAEIGEELGDGSGGHRGAAVGVQGELAGGDCFGGGAGGDEFFGEAVGFAWCDEPADGVAGVDVQDDVEVEPGPFVGAGEFGDVPGPHLVRCGGDEFGFDVGGSAGLAASFADLVLGAQDPVHGRHRGQVAAFVEQRRPDLGGGLVAEPFAS